MEYRYKERYGMAHRGNRYFELCVIYSKNPSRFLLSEDFLIYFLPYEVRAMWRGQADT